MNPTTETNSRKKMNITEWLMERAQKEEGAFYTSEGLIKIPWVHAAKRSWDSSKHAQIFKLWAEHSGHRNVSQKKWKPNFRCALNSRKDLIEKVKKIVENEEVFLLYRVKKQKKSFESNSNPSSPCSLDSCSSSSSPSSSDSQMSSAIVKPKNFSYPQSDITSIDSIPPSPILHEPLPISSPFSSNKELLPPFCSVFSNFDEKNFKRKICFQELISNNGSKLLQDSKDNVVFQVEKYKLNDFLNSSIGS